MTYDFDYCILSSHSIETLKKEVLEHLLGEWKCQGGVAVSKEYDSIFKKDSEIFLQAMVKTKANLKNG
jgi:hypothetical protein